MLSHFYRVTFLGKKGSGKSAIIIQFTQNCFIENYEVEYDSTYRKMFSTNGEEGILDILEQVYTHPGCIENSINLGEGIVLAYSITSKESFDSISFFYEKILEIKGDSPYSLILVGNKCDLDKERQVSTEEGEELAQHMKCPFYEISAKTRKNIEECFHELECSMVQKRIDNPIPPNQSVPVRPIRRKK